MKPPPGLQALGAAGLLNRPFGFRAVRSLDQVLTDSWRADAGVTNSGGVSSWQSQLSAKVATEATNKPTFVASDPATGLPCIQFDGVNDKLTVAAGSFSAGVVPFRTWVFVRRANQQGGTYDYLTQIGAGTEDIMSSGPAGHCGVQTVGVFTPAIPASRELCIEVYRMTASVCELWRDGYLLGTASITSVNLAGNNLILCSGGGSNYAANDIFEWGVHETRAISDSEIRALSRYAIARYGITPAIPRSNVLSDSVMCFGDSNVAAGVAQNQHAWREQLRARLPGVTFLGTQLLVPPYSQHEGVGGDTYPQMQARLAAALAANPTPLVMLVFGGLNDSAGAVAGATIATRMRSFVEAAFAISPTTRYAVLDLPPSSDAGINTRNGDFNAAINAHIAAMVGNGIKVSRITAYSTILVGDMADTVHPNASGYLKVARLLDPAIKGWFAAA